MRSLIRFSLVLSVAFLGLTQTDAQATTGSQTGTIVGIVLDAAGAPVPDALVEIELRTANGRTYTVRGRTNGRGYFGFRHVPEGHGVAKAGKRGVGRGRSAIRVKGGHRTRVRIDI